MQQVSARITDVTDNKIVSMTECRGQRPTHSTKSCMGSSLFEQCCVDAAESILHPPHHRILFFRSPTELPVRRSQGEIKKVEDRLSACDLACSFTADTVRDNHSICRFLKPISGTTFNQVAENSFQISSAASHEKMIFVLSSDMSLM